MRGGGSAADDGKKLLTDFYLKYGAKSWLLRKVYKISDHFLTDGVCINMHTFMNTSLITTSKALFLLVASSLLPIHAEQVSPYQLKDCADIKLTGRVTQASAHAFTLDYGKGSIVVELDDYDSYEEGYNIEKGDQVIVTGKVDADPGQKRTIEASEVYIPAADLRIEACAHDEEDLEVKAYTQRLSNGTEVELRGVIKNIESGVCTIQSSKGNIEVHLSDLREQKPETLLLGQAIKVSGVYKNRLLRNDLIIAQKVEPTTRKP